MPENEEIFNRSYRLARSSTVNGVSFEDALFDNLLRSCPEVAQRILTGNMEAFRSTLMLSIDNLARYYANGKPTTMLQGVARRQSRCERNIEPRLYEFFLKALLKTVQEYDAKYNEEVGKAWEVVLRPGIEYMKQMY